MIRVVSLVKSRDMEGSEWVMAVSYDVNPAVIAGIPHVALGT